MYGKIVVWFKKTYKILIVALAAIIFFLGYNTYLVDRSLTNLRVTLNRIDDIKSLEDAKKLSALLEYSLVTEIASPELQALTLSKLEIARNILSTQKDAAQLEDVKFALQEVIKQKEKDRAPLLGVIDKLSKGFASPTVKFPKSELEKRAKLLREKLKVIKDKNDVQQVYYELANIYTQLADYNRVREAYDKLISLDPESKIAKKSKFNLAWNAKFQGNVDEAIAEFDVLSKAYPREEIGAFSLYQMAESLDKKGDFVKAVAVYQQIAQQQPDSELAKTALFRMGSIYLDELKDYDKAKEMFDKCGTTKEKSIVAEHVKKTTTPRMAAGYRKEGFKLLREGYNLSSPEKYQEAQKYFDKSLEIEPNEGVAYIGRALVLFWLNDSDGALDFARRAVKVAPSNEVASVNLGYIYIQLGLFEDAITEYKRLISINSGVAWAYYNLGCAYAFEKKYADAVMAFRQASRIDSKFIFALNNYGWALWQTGRYSEAIEALEQAVAIDKQSADVYYNLGIIYAATGKYVEAKSSFQRVLQIDSSYADANTHLQELIRLAK